MGVNRVLTTGSAGFLGSWVVERLLELGYEVTVFDLAKPGKIGHLLDRIRFVQGDVRSPEDCAEAVEDSDAIIHLAALINVDHSVQEPRPFYEVNVGGTMNLLEAARDAGVNKFCQMSTFECYGNIPQGRADETYLCDPRSPYAASKYSAERYCLSWQATYGKPEVTVLRGANIYGPRQSAGAKGAVTAIFITRVLRGDPPLIYGDGSQTRDFVFVRDMARGVVSALRRGLGGEVINLCSGTTVSVTELAELVLRAADSDLKPVYVAARAGENLRSCGNPDKALMLLGWKAETPYLQGLRETVEYFKSL